MYFKEFEIRWSDVDANMHLRNSAYVDYMSHTRMRFLHENGLGFAELAKLGVGPIALYEQIFYFKEAFPDQKIRVSLELNGISEDGTFFEFVHNFYDENNRNLARTIMGGAWLDMKTRKLTTLPQEHLVKIEALTKTADFRILTAQDTRRFNQLPKDLE